MFFKYFCKSPQQCPLIYYKTNKFSSISLNWSLPKVYPIWYLDTRANYILYDFSFLLFHPKRTFLIWQEENDFYQCCEVSLDLVSCCVSLMVHATGFYLTLAELYFRCYLRNASSARRQKYWRNLSACYASNFPGFNTRSSSRLTLQGGTRQMS